VRGSHGGAYRTRADTNEGLIEGLVANGRIRSKDVRDAMLKVDRGDFTTMEAASEAYNDYPLSIGKGQTISAPHMHAEALEMLRAFLRPGARVLDVGSGSGYLSVCMAKMVGPKGKVVGIDVVESLVSASIENVKKSNKNLLDSGNLEILKGDGWAGYSKEAPYDAIHVGAAAASIPEELVGQLKPGGWICLLDAI